MGKRSKKSKRRAAKHRLRLKIKEQEKKKEKVVAGCNKTNFSKANISNPLAGGQVNVASAKDDDWEVKLDIVKECSKVSDNGAAIVWIEPLAKVKIDALMGEYKSQEWLAYLLGVKEDRIVKDIFVPEQKATSARVDDVECEEFNNLSVIGVIHSHHGMGTGFSGTDHTYINQNHDISLVVAHTGIDGQVRTKVPCGALMISEAKIKLKLNVDNFDKDKFLEVAKENIKKPTFNYMQPVQQNWQRNVQGPGGRAGQSGYWFMGEWHEADPFIEDKEILDPKEIDDEIQRIHGAETTPASFWLCKNCNTQNYTMTSTLCWSCSVDSSKVKTGGWICRECKGTNNQVNATHCIYCKTQRRPLTQAEKNQLQIEKEWGTKVSKNIGNYICGRCKTEWKDVDLKKFTECPNCDIHETTLAERLEKELDDEEKKSTNVDIVEKDTTTTSPGSNVAGSTKNPYLCSVCGKHVSIANSQHMACFAKRQSEKEVNDTVWQTDKIEPVV
jgi:proteasome lid subunit RPN8/RPN11/DNA-directed RNA polymerase subunit RPC12/RpoP